MCVAPKALLVSGSLRINATYYIEKCVVPALGRLLNIVGADVAGWWESMPRQYKAPLTHVASSSDAAGGRRTVDSYFQSRECVLCFEEHRGRGHFCAACAAQPQRLTFLMQSRLGATELQHAHIREICLSCCDSIGLGPPRDAALADGCDSLDCSVMYERAKVSTRVAALQACTSELPTVA